MSNKELFQGFIPPVDDYFRMPNEWINICAEIKSLAELKIVQYVLRHTWGYQDYDGVRKLTLDEFMHGRKRRDGTRIDKGTGLSDRGVKDGIALAMEHGYLICEVDDKDKARIKKSYGIKMISELPDRKNLPPKKNSDRKNSPIQDGKNLPPDRKNSPIEQEDSSQRSEKDTKERHLKKNIEKDSKRVPSRTSTPSQPSSQEKSSSVSSQEEEVEFSPEEQTIYDFGKETIFRVKPPKKTPYVKGQCAEIAKAGIKTLEQFKSLVALSKQETGFKTLHLGNLINALNGWLFIQQFNDSAPPQAPTSKTDTAPSSYDYDDDDFEDDTFYSVREVKTREEAHATR